MHILLIDDDLDDQILFREAAQQISSTIEVALASNGVEGLDYLTLEHVLPALVFLDINMPLMDGHEVIKVIRSTPRLKALDVIIYTTSNMASEKAHFESMDARFVTKPTDFTLLIKLLRRELNMIPSD